MALDLITALFRSIQQVLIELAALYVAAMQTSETRLLSVRSSQTNMENIDKHINTTHHDKGNNKGKPQHPPKVISSLLGCQ